MLWVDRTGVIQAGSAGFGWLLGLDPASLMGLPISTLYRADQSGVAAAELQIARLSGSFRREGERLRGDGRMVAVRAITLALPNNLGFLEWLEDLTEELMCRSALAQLQARWETLSKVATDAVVEVDRELRIVFACPTARSWLAAEGGADELVLDALPIRRILRTAESVRDLPVRLPSPSAPSRVLLRAAPLQRAGGEPLGVLCCLTDAERQERGWYQSWSQEVDRALAARVLAGQEEVQRRIARELHDDLGQGLTGLRLMLEQEQETVRTREARALTVDLLQRTRTLSQALRPAILDDLGLAAALDALVQQVRSQSACEVTLQLSLAEKRYGRLPHPLELTAYRVAQEGLTNALRHAAGCRIQITASRSPEHLLLVVQDDGPGFDPAAEAGRVSSGLSGMRDRAAIHGCDLEVRSAPGQGCRVQLTCPL